MLVSLEWLSQYVNIEGLSPQEISEALTNSGLEVESIQQQGGAFSGVVVGKIISVDKHPNADKLRLVQVSLGNEQMQVVCGAPNVQANMLIALAKLGAQVISRKDGSAFVLEPAQIRGVESKGMICSIDELGLQDRYPKTEDGIWPIATIVGEDQIGVDLKVALKLEADTILEVAPTANRGDLMSLTGVAREVAALFDRELHFPETLPPAHHNGTTNLLVKLQEPDVCQYYAGAVLRNVKVGPSPDWMSRRLEAAGVRAINNVVDITNYVMLETGQPLHAFDHAKLGLGGEVGVRRAKEKETLKTLDGTERPLTNESVVITLNNRAVALAGVMGGEDTEIDDNSKGIFLESAFFPPASNRRSAKSVGIRTEASARFERGVDPGSCKTALYRAIAFLEKYAGAEYVNMSESSGKLVKELEVSLRYKRIEKILGIAIEKEQVSKTLKKLGFLLKPAKEPDKVVVTVPTFRQIDVYREIDVIEEIIRIYGYDRVPYTLPERTATAELSTRQKMLERIRSVITGAGLQEVVTTSLIGDALLEKTGFSLDRAQAVSVSNSHSEEHTILRQSLLPNLLEVAKFNLAQGLDDVWLFELGRTYFKKGKATEKHSGVVEKLCLSGLLTGSTLQGNWHMKQPTDFYVVKGILERLFNVILPLDAVVQYAADASLPFLHPGKTAQIGITGLQQKSIGFLGELHPTIHGMLKFRQPVYLFELDVEALAKLLKQAQVKPKLTRLSAFPFVKRDMAFSAPDTLAHQEIQQAIQTLNDPLIREIVLFDEYRSEQLGAGKRSLAYRLTLQSDDNTLSEGQIEAVMTTVKKTLSEKLPVTFR